MTTHEEVPGKFLSVLECLGPGCFGLLEAFMTQLHDTKDQWVSADCTPGRGEHESRNSWFKEQIKLMNQGTDTRQKCEVEFVKSQIRGRNVTLSLSNTGSVPSCPVPRCRSADAFLSFSSLPPLCLNTFNSYSCHHLKDDFSGCAIWESLPELWYLVDFRCQSCWSVRLGSPMWTWAALRLSPFPAQLLDLLFLSPASLCFKWALSICSSWVRPLIS